ncbi:MAG: hypothetical protein OWU84_11450 [Firmicutes bacterium]|nr:hypothetical protein [Bacillota bacterium]
MGNHGSAQALVWQGVRAAPVTHPAVPAWVAFVLVGVAIAVFLGCCAMSVKGAQGAERRRAADPGRARVGNRERASVISWDEVQARRLIRRDSPWGHGKRRGG